MMIRADAQEIAVGVSAICGGRTSHAAEIDGIRHRQAEQIAVEDQRRFLRLDVESEMAKALHLKRPRQVEAADIVGLGLCLGPSG